MSLNLSVVALFAAGLAVRAADGPETAAKGLPLTLSVIALILLGASGWLGGKLAYRYGVRVADEATQAEGFR